MAARCSGPQLAVACLGAQPVDARRSCGLGDGHLWQTTPTWIGRNARPGATVIHTSASVARVQTAVASSVASSSQVIARMLAYTWPRSMP
jgi:hypothetical protein